MATGWVRSVHCKSNVSDDVIIPPKSKLLLPRSCTRSQALKDSIFSFHRTKPINPKTVIKSKTMPVPPSPPPPLLSASVPSIVQLPPDHPTHGVVERIFLSSWSSKSNREASPFPGEIKIVFRIRHPIKALAQFEQYRAGLRGRCAGSEPRCIADGNEMMCFHCPAGGEVKYGDGLSGYKGIRTFSGSGGAHESVGKDMMGKRAMLCICSMVTTQQNPSSIKFNLVAAT
ncbi:uncharacterized protein LOC144547282 [Carex rostrata]